MTIFITNWNCPKWNTGGLTLTLFVNNTVNTINAPIGELAEDYSR